MQVVRRRLCRRQPSSLPSFFPSFVVVSCCFCRLCRRSASFLSSFLSLFLSSLPSFCVVFVIVSRRFCRLCRRSASFLSSKDVSERHHKKTSVSCWINAKSFEPTVLEYCQHAIDHIFNHRHRVGKQAYLTRCPASPQHHRDTEDSSSHPKTICDSTASFLPSFIEWGLHSSRPQFTQWSSVAVRKFSVRRLHVCRYASPHFTGAPNSKVPKGCFKKYIESIGINAMCPEM